MNKGVKVIDNAEQVAKTAEDYALRLSQLIEEEGNKIREKADQESAPIIAKAREEYKLRLGQFLEEEGARIRRETEMEAASIITKAEAERDNIITKARTDAQFQIEQTIGEVRKMAEQESAKYVNDSKKKAEYIVTTY